MPSLEYEGKDEQAIAYATGRGVVYLDERGSDGDRYLECKAGEFRVLPKADSKKREVIYIAGRSGCGKSHWAKEYAKAYRKLFPTRPVYLFSHLKEDSTLDEIRPVRIRIDTLVEEPIELKELKHSLCIFDDYDAVTPKIKKELVRLIDTIASMGRHEVVSMIVISHLLTNYKDTRLLLNESTLFVVFPDGAAAKPLERLVGHYAGIDPSVFQMLRQWHSRWLAISVQHPAYVVGERNIVLL